MSFRTTICSYPGCGEPKPHSLWGCPKHQEMVPEHLKNKLRRKIRYWWRYPNSESAGRRLAQMHRRVLTELGVPAGDTEIKVKKRRVMEECT